MTTNPPDALGQLLRGEWRDPDDGALLAVPVRAVAIERTLRGAEADLVMPLQLGPRLAVISDRVTREVLGERVERALAGRFALVPVVLDGQPHADTATVACIVRACAAADALVAVGSGTINDLCKHAAALAGKPYVVFATAPSMNGYTSANAAITVDGHKQSLPAAPPLGVFIDLEVFAAAPARMIRAGLGDSLCRATAQCDWLLSHALHGTRYRRAPFALLAPDEPGLLDEPEALLRGDIEAMRALARTLVLSGLGMTICGGSYPASQGEHLISHYIDMFAPEDRASCFHGEQVAVATLTMARIQEASLASGPPQFVPSSVTCADLQGQFGAAIGQSCWSSFAAKRLRPDTADQLTRHVASNWNSIVANSRDVMIDATRIERIMHRVDGPTTPADLGLTADFYAEAVRNARFLRDRYTFLDFADDAGRLSGSTSW